MPEKRPPRFTDAPLSTGQRGTVSVWSELPHGGACGEGVIVGVLSVLIDRRRGADALDALAAAVPGGQRFENIPIAVVDEASADEATLRSLPGILGVEPLTADRRAILYGFDRAGYIIRGQRHQWTVGGVEPGHPYPSVDGQPIGTAAPPAVCAAINLSLGDRHDALVPTSPDDSVIHALDHLSNSTVCVVAAGNGHDTAHRFETLSPWAESDAVLSVGATEDEAGTAVAPYSARGGELRPDLGPDILAWGRSALDPPEFGTSFAAARASAFVAIVRSWLGVVRANVDLAHGAATGVPLSGVFMIDIEFLGSPRPYRPPAPFAAIPIFSTHPGQAEQLAGIADRLATPAASRAVLLAAAQSDSPTSPSPSISTSRLHGWLDRAPAADVIAAIEGTEPPEAGDPPLFEPGVAIQIDEFVRATMPIWEWEIPTARGRMRHDRHDPTRPVESQEQP